MRPAGTDPDPDRQAGPEGADGRVSGSPAIPVCFGTLAVLDDYVLIPVHGRSADMFRPDVPDAELASWIRDAGARSVRSTPG